MLGFRAFSLRISRPVFRQLAGPPLNYIRRYSKNDNKPKKSPLPTDAKTIEDKMNDVKKSPDDMYQQLDSLIKDAESKIHEIEDELKQEKKVEVSELEPEEITALPMLINETPEKSPLRNQPPEYYPKAICIPVSRRPLIPGFYKSITIKDPQVATVLKQRFRHGDPHLGLFLSKDDNVQSDCISSLNDIYPVGALASIINILPHSDDGITVIVYPHRRIIATSLLEPSTSEKDDASHIMSIVKIENIKDKPFDSKDRIIRVITQEIFNVLTDIAKMNTFFRQHIIHYNVSGHVLESPTLLADFVAVLVSAEPHELQGLMEAVDVTEKLKLALVLLKKEFVNAQLQQAISKDVEQKINHRQREYFLLEQLKVIKKELGMEADSKDKIVETFRKKAAELDMPENVKLVFDEEIAKLTMLEPVGSEFNITRNYIDWLVQVPWGKNTKEEFDIAQSSRILNEDHYGLDDVKNRILEFIAVGRLRGTVQGKIICLVGPPGVGKTSIGRSIARTLNRKYYRFSVGGLSDVSEIKGHRRTYVGAMPGKVIQALKISGSCNPLILIDEIDKIGRSSHHGDPSSALLELLDPEQNNSFLDHYLDVPVDLSKVLFVCTANVLDTIPGPLLDRMEVIQLSGYISQEKKEIAKQYLIPQALKDCGLESGIVDLPEETVSELIRGYCREAGVRNLKKHIEKIFRKAALNLVKEQKLPVDTKPEESLVRVTSTTLPDYVGSPVFTSERMYETTPVGVIMGLAWTSMGGSVLYIETTLESIRKDKPQPTLIRTGQLGKVMEESSSIAYTVAKTYLHKLYPTNDFFETASIHLHVPEGAVPKDGPSAGITMATSLLSLALDKPVAQDIAMTGELSLTGKILRIGGLKEKAIAAKQAGISRIIFPKGNESDWKAFPDHIKEGLEPLSVESFDQVIQYCFPE